MDQPENKHRHIWAISAFGENLPWCIDDAKQQLLADLSWFDHLTNPTNVLASLLDEPGAPELGGFFNNPSPNHSYLTGYVALRCGNEAVARDYFERAIKSQSFPHFFNSVEGAIYRSKYALRAP